MGILKMGAKDPDGNAKAVASNKNGNLVTERTWFCKEHTIYAGPLTDSQTELRKDAEGKLYSPEFSLTNEGTGLVSLRFQNATGVPVKVTLCMDTFSTLNTLYDIDGGEKSFLLTASRNQVVTPDDWPILNYLQKISLRLEPQGTPAADKNITIRAIIKR